MKYLNNRFSQFSEKTWKKSQKQLFKQKQQGVVLFFALIALVVMSLAAVALIRSVDTNSLIAGNLSFKQSSILSADRGVEDAITWLKFKQGVLTVHPLSLNTDLVADGYYATSDVAPHLDAKALVDASGLVDMTDTQGNAISYVVQRMCVQKGVNTDTHDKRLLNCLFGPGEDTGCMEATAACIASRTAATKRLVYRITAKVVGPKNTTSYIQTFVF